MTERLGGSLVVETLRRLGADTCFGLPGQHALAIFEGLRESEMRYVGLRTEVAASFAADGYARASGRAAPLFVSTGPGALMSLAGLMEAETSSVPVVAISSQIPRAGLGAGRGYIHELRDQRASFEPVVKRTFAVREPEEIPEVIAAAWAAALEPPSGPTYVEIPVDVLGATTTAEPPAGPARIPAPVAPAEQLERAAELLQGAERPVILAGGGVVRSGGWDELRELAERLGAPVAESYGGRGAFPADHPLSAGSHCEDKALMEFLADADVLFLAGSALSEETTNHFTLEPRGTVIHLDADPRKITADRVPLLGDARATLAELCKRVEPVGDDAAGRERAAAVRAEVEARLAGQGRELERGLLADIRAALPADAAHVWDMTILAYWAAPTFPAGAPRRFLWPQGSGSLGYGFPASLGAKAALGDEAVLAISGDGGAAYGVAELASARQAALAAKWLIVNDGRYGVLRGYQRAAYGPDAPYATELIQPDFVALAEAYGVPAARTSPESLRADLERLLAGDGPGVLVLEATLEMFEPTHLEEA